MSQNRSLGIGRIRNMVKKYAYIADEKLGTVYFPIAACVTSVCDDMRERFENDEEVIFTAQKQSQVQNDCRFIASSVVKTKELVIVTGKIAETCEKFCYAEVKRFGRVFVPYSARTDNSNKPWLGKGAEVSKTFYLKIFRQPDINNCRYVAWAISMTGFDDKKGDKIPDVASGQVGVIVKFPANGDCTVYSSQSGTARLPDVIRKPWMSLGRCIRYDVVIHVEDGKGFWIVRNPEDLGLLYEVIEDDMDHTKLLLRLTAVVNRVSQTARCAWLWNDVIGRIFVPIQQFSRGLHAMVSVKILAVWTGAFEDVPWSAMQVEVLSDGNEVRASNAQLLLTDDGWVVTFINTQQSTFYGFMNNPKYGSAFLTWTDVTEGDSHPKVDTKCRVTVFRQFRYGKHTWRAVLVTPLGTDGHPIWHHPMHIHSGRQILPEPFKAPLKPLHKTPVPILTSLSTPFSIRDRILSSLPAPIAAPISQEQHSPTAVDSPSPVTQLSPAPQVLSSDSSDAYSDQNGGMDIDLSSFSTFMLWQNKEFLKWAPIGCGEQPFPSIPLSRLSSTSNTCDAETQTDMLSEQQVLKDIIGNDELLVQVLQHFPEHCNRIMNIRWHKN